MKITSLSYLAPASTKLSVLDLYLLVLVPYFATHRTHFAQSANIPQFCSLPYTCFLILSLFLIPKILFSFVFWFVRNRLMLLFVSAPVWALYIRVAKAQLSHNFIFTFNEIFPLFIFLNTQELFHPFWILLLNSFSLPFWNDISCL